MNLRPYQTEAVEAIMESFEDSRSTLIVMATGTGKTIVFGHVIERFMRRGRVMVIAHREELLAQAKDKIQRITGHEPAIEKAEQYALEGGMWRPQIIVASIQTLDRRGKRFNPEQFSLIVVDEAHHAPAVSYRRCLKHFTEDNENLRVLGVTATPDRHDEEALGQVFDSVSYEYDVLAGVTDGWLVPIDQQFVQVDGLDYSDCKTTAGDLNGADLARVMEDEHNLHGIVYPTIEIAKGKRTLVFAASVNQAQRVAEIFNRHEPNSAEFVCGKTPKDERTTIIERFRSGDCRILTNVGVATEGFDVPGVDVVVMARPTKSRALYAQMLGRGTRPLDGLVDAYETAEARRSAIAASAKPNMTVLDFSGNSGRHKLITAADILGGNYSDDVVEAAVRDMERSGKPDDVQEALRKAYAKQKKIREEQERKLRRKIKAKAKFKSRTMDPFSLFDLTPEREKAYYQGKTVTSRMRATMERMGLDADMYTYQQARQIIGEQVRRWKAKLCTMKQAKLLSRYGYETKDLKFDDASRLITRIKNNGWRPLVRKWEPVT